MHCQCMRIERVLSQKVCCIRKMMKRLFHPSTVEGGCPRTAVMLAVLLYATKM